MFQITRSSKFYKYNQAKEGVERDNDALLVRWEAGLFDKIMLEQKHQ